MRAESGPARRIPRLVLLNKPYRVMCQFADRMGRLTLASFLSLPGIYPVGRLDYESEGLVVLTDSGRLQHLVSDPRNKNPKTYWVQVEGEPGPEQVALLLRGVHLPDGQARASHVAIIAEPRLWPRDPPIRRRASAPTSWLEITLEEGRKHVVRHLTAAVGCPTLRLIRYSVGPWTIGSMQPGEWKEISLPQNWESHLQHTRSPGLR
jgi:23S rRNA pseudouridine2457 synthase